MNTRMRVAMLVSLIGQNCFKENELDINIFLIKICRMFRICKMFLCVKHGYLNLRLSQVEETKMLHLCQRDTGNRENH